MFPKKDEEERLLAEYHATDTAAAAATDTGPNERKEAHMSEKHVVLAIVPDEAAADTASRR